MKWCSVMHRNASRLMQDFGFGLLLLMYSPQPSPIIEIIPGGSFLCALCVSVFHHLRDTSGHNWLYLPLVWLPPHKHKHTRWQTHIHIYTDTHGHTAARADTLIFNDIIYFLTRTPPPTGPWTCHGCDILLLCAQCLCGSSDQKIR